MKPEPTEAPKMSSVNEENDLSGVTSESPRPAQGSSTDVPEWKRAAIDAAEIQATKEEAAKQVKVEQQKERSRATFGKYLTNCGVPFRESDIQFEFMKPYRALRTFAIIDGVEFTTVFRDYGYDGCAVMRQCWLC